MDAETRETDEAAVVSPDFDRSVVECRQADLEIEDPRTLDAELPGQPQEPVPEAFARRPESGAGLGDERVRNPRACRAVEGPPTLWEWVTIAQNSATLGSAIPQPRVSRLASSIAWRAARCSGREAR